ncbi:MotA/TolQ/ExbB proton channel [Candidatus Magnetomorum sp. HK-1]|nr:MotA/TolQ/ExbB proton channel [Candidatus Magnetomorum sp. HK-1]
MFRLLIWALFFMVSLIPNSYAKDMRLDVINAEKQKNILIQKALDTENQAKKDSLARHQKIVSDRSALLKAIKKLKNQNKQIKKDIINLDTNISNLKQSEKSLQDDLAENENVNKELSGYIHHSVKSMKSLFNQSIQSALIKNRGAFLTSMTENQFPSMDNIQAMVDDLFHEIQLSGEVKRTKGLIVDREGKEINANILILGNFTAMYTLPTESGFLLYSNQSNRLFALSKLPKKRIIAKNQSYIQGKTDDIYMDISKGGALRQLTHALSLWDQIPKGGPIVWPIIAILGLAILIVLERIIFIARKHINTNTFMQKLAQYIHQEQWDDCIQLLKKKNQKLVPKILERAIALRNKSREDMENVLQEAILAEIPRLERFLSTLGMLAAIAPLLGLLGTVTGMINTFHVITYYGTGDPRMMSGGISEALVTTMLGLSVAIPIMLAHTLLTRKIENEIGQMEEKAVSFVNMIFKTRSC